MNIRDERQLEFAIKWIKSDRKGILLLAPRFGKIRVAINIFKGLPSSYERILIAYPDVKIRKSWEEDFIKWGYSNPNIIFTTFVSLKKHVSESFDLIVIDECHLLSPAQINVCIELFNSCKEVLGLTGTLSSWTEKVLREDLHLPVIARYSIETAIREGILPDYEINIVRVPLDNRFIRNFGKKKKTEFARFRDFKYLMDKEDKSKPSFFIRLKMIEILQSSRSKAAATVNLIMEFFEERLLVFCGRTEIADNLGIPSFHSKSTDKKMWEDFIEGREKHMAVCKIGNTGVTYKPLNKVIINYFSSSSEDLTQKILRCMSMEYDNPDKKAIIYIICSTEDIEIKWLSKALLMFQQNKIHVI